MPRMPPLDRRATYDDLLELPDHLVGEIVDGELHANARPALLVAGTAIVLGNMLSRGQDRSSRDAWQILPGPELHLGADVFVPALAGWRLARLPELPATPYFSTAPDWVCEIARSGTASLRARKMAIYADERVTHVWLLDPTSQTLEARSLEGGRWTVLGSHTGGQVVRAVPFEALALPLSALWRAG